MTSRDESAAIKRIPSGLRSTRDWRVSFSNSGVRDSPSSYRGCWRQLCIRLFFPMGNSAKHWKPYVVRLNASKTEFLRREAPRPDELRRTVVRGTIEKAGKSMAVFHRQTRKFDLRYYIGYDGAAAPLASSAG